MEVQACVFEGERDRDGDREERNIRRTQTRLVPICSFIPLCSPSCFLFPLAFVFILSSSMLANAASVLRLGPFVALER